MVLIDQITFFKLIEQFEVVPYTQTKGMFEFHALAGINRIKFFVNNTEAPTIACFGHEKSFGLKKMILIEGECHAISANLNVDEIRIFYNEFTKFGYDFIEVCSNAEYNFNYETALRQAGYLRPVGQFSMPLTKVVDLASEIIYTRNWKQNIKKANRNNLKFEPVINVQLSDCVDFVFIYSEMLKRKSLGSILSTEQVYALCKTGDFCLYFVTYQNRRIAARITHERKTHAGSWYAATNNDALHLSASFFLYKAVLDYLKEKGFHTFDMEKLVPSTKSVNNVFLFKDGIVGKYVQLNGEWSWYKKQYYRPVMYFVKKYLMKKKEL